MAPSFSTPSIILKCDFQLEGAKEVALVWDGQEHPIKCTSGKYKASFEVPFENEGPIPVHVRISPLIFAHFL